VNEVVFLTTLFTLTILTEYEHKAFLRHVKVKLYITPTLIYIVLYFEQYIYYILHSEIDIIFK